ncbi:hypothetical protein ACFY2J_38660 [Streptomyces collinus]|uniref:hypothetical protein n=1 Tax=Streptomyces collinus TaxID=42684 RepID=UPI0036AF8F4A
MSTPAPAAKDQNTLEEAEKEFQPKAFPADLIAAQLRLGELYAALHAHQKRLAWTREEHPGWPKEEEERGRKHEGRPLSPGWGKEDAAAYDRLWDELRQAAAAVQCHDHWARCRALGVKGADLVDVRQALKHAKGAVPAPAEDAAPLAQGDVRPAA